MSVLQEIIQASEQKEALQEALGKVIQHNMEWNLEKRYEDINEMKWELLTCFRYKKW